MQGYPMPTSAWYVYNDFFFSLSLSFSYVLSAERIGFATMCIVIFGL